MRSPLVAIKTTCRRNRSSTNKSPGLESLLLIFRGCRWSGHDVAQLLQHARCLAWNSSYHSGHLPPTPTLTSGLDVVPPAIESIEAAFNNQELEQVFEAWPEPATSHGNMQRRHVMRGSVLSARKEVRKGAALSMNVNMCVRSRMHVVLVLKP